MIYQLCNNGNEQNETFYKVSVIKISSLAPFNTLTSDDDIKDIIENLPDTSDVINTDLLPENLNLTATTRTNDQGVFYAVNSSFTLTPQDKLIKEFLDQYNNTEVILLLAKHSSTYLYGTTTSPLIFTYNQLHSPTAQGLKGYSLRLNGLCIGSVKQFENIELNIFNRGLAFNLAGTL